MTQELLDDAEQRMTRTCQVLERELAGIRTGRASPALLEELRIDYYGSPTPLKQLADYFGPLSRASSSCSRMTAERHPTSRRRS